MNDRRRPENEPQDATPTGWSRRRVLAAGTGLVAVPLLGGLVGCSRSSMGGDTSPPSSGTAPVAASAPRASLRNSRRRLGALDVSAIGLGCMSMNGRQYNPPKDKAEMIRLIHTAIDRGVDFLDTAEVYGPFLNEELVGEALAPHRQQVVIATKFGFGIEYPSGRRTGGVNSRPEHIRKVVDESLARPAHGLHRPAVPASGRSAGADRGCRRHSEGSGRCRQGQALWAVRAGLADGAPGACRAACRSNPERVLTAGARTGERATGPVPGTGHRDGALVAAGRRATHRRT